MSGADSSSSYFDNVDFLDDPYAFARQDTDRAGSSSKQPARRDETGKRGSGQQARREQKQRLNGRDNEARGGGGSAMDVDGPGTRGVADGMGAGDSRESEQNDVQRLMRAWQDERHAPDILPAQDELLGRVLDSIRQQTHDVNALRRADITLSEEDHYMTMLVQTEVERIKFLVRSYVRTRLAKIEQFAAYIVGNKSIERRLTRAEQEHARRYAKLIVSQLNMTVLNHLPEAQRALDDAVPTLPNMITEPDNNKPVLFHSFVEIERLIPALTDEGDLTLASLSSDGLVLLPYQAIEQNILRGEGELV